MSWHHGLRYHLNVDLLGRAFLRFERLRSERRFSDPSRWKHPHLSRPLDLLPRFKELVSGHYLSGRYANPHKKVAWVTSGAPVEFLKALGFHLHYPENHGAVCGVRRKAVEACEVAEEAGYSRILCSYARTDFGTILSGRSPTGRLPRPDLLLCCNNICQTVLSWYRVLARHFDVPLILIDTPFVYDKASDHAVDFVKRQLREAIPVAEKVSDRTLREEDLMRIIHLSREAALLWLEIIQRGRARPAPITAFDQFILMGPIVEMRGDQVTIDFYRDMLTELDRRIEAGTGALRTERKRIVWDNLPIWHQMRHLSNLFAESGVSCVTSTYTNAWGELAPMMDPEHPWDSLARVYLHPILNRGTGDKLQTIRTMVEDFEADGVILHSDRSCKPYSVGQMDQRDRLARELGVPAILLEADHNDERAWTPEVADNRLAAFFEMMEG